MDYSGYCRNETDEAFERKVLVDFLGNLRRFDLRTFENKPTMAKARRRVVFGAMETRKLLELGKVKVIIVARNLADDVLLEEDFKYCIENENVPIIYCLTRKQLGATLLNQSSRIGIVGVLKLDGVHEFFNEILDQLKILQESWIKRYESNASVLDCTFYGHLDLLQRKFELNEQDLIGGVNVGCFKTGMSPLMIAVDRDHLKIVQFLIEKCNADQDIPDFALNRPFHLVKSLEVAKLLNACDKKNAAGLFPIEVAIINERIEVLSVLLESIADDKVLLASTRCKSDKSIRFLHNKLGIDMNLKGNFLLTEAVENGSYEVFKYLIGSKIEIDFTILNGRNENIIDIARRVGNVGILRYLKKHVKEIKF